MDQIETLMLSDGAEKPEEGYIKASDIVEWHVQADPAESMEGASEGCGCGGCSITL